MPLAVGTVQLLSSHGGISTEEAEALNKKGGPRIAGQGVRSQLWSRAGDAGKELTGALTPALLEPALCESSTRAYF